MTEQQSSYRQIIKATSIFGGVQVFQIIIQIIRSKFIAILLGPTGMGIMGLLSSTTVFVSQLTNFGLGVSSVKNVAAANGTGNEVRIATIVIILRRLVWITGTLGALITLVLSSWLSQLTFGNHDYTIAFIWISSTVLFNQLTNGQLIILQGLRKLQYLAKANLSGSFLGLLITIPLYYKFGVDGIVPSIIIASIISLLFSWFFARKISIKPVKVSQTRTIAEGKEMLTMGFMISMSNVLFLGVSYIVRIYLSRHGGVEQVGLYNAGFAIINSYTGLIFVAMGTDYYPKLSAVAHSNILSKQTINQQAEVSLLILAPILIVFMVFIKWVVIILYSSQFIAVSVMIYWAALGIFFKTASWAVAYVFLAKGASKLFFWNELAFNIYTLGFNLIGYYYYGLTGLGLSFLFSYIIYLVQVYVIAKNKFEFAYNRPFVKIFCVQFILAASGFVIVKLLDEFYAYIIGTIIICISLWFSYIELNKRIGIRSILGLVYNKLRFKN
jgi:O-antigen/teichoic acid export membrane protein